MLTEQTVERLHHLRLGAMADAYLAQQRDPAAASLSFDERLGMLVDAEHLARENRALRRRLKEAKLKLSQACLEDLDYSGRKLDRAPVRQLATCRWVAEHQNILITGPTGVGKSFLACALGQQACRQRHRVIYRRLPRLFPELTLAHGDGTYPTVLARFARVDVLILDDWGVGGLTDAQRQDLLEILDDRDGNRSTIITSQTADRSLARALGRSHARRRDSRPRGASRASSCAHRPVAPQGEREWIIRVEGRGMSRERGRRGRAIGRATSRSLRIRSPVPSCCRRGSLWTVPELWKTHRARFPQLLGRRTARAAHNGPQAFVSIVLKKEEEEPLQ